MSGVVKISASLANARFIDTGEGRVILSGNIYGDKLKLFRDGHLIYTAPVERVEGDLAFTKTMTYRLIKEQRA